MNEVLLIKLLGLLDALSEEKGVPKQESLVNKNVIKSEKSTFNSGEAKSSGLDSGQKRTLTETFSLFNKLFFDYQKKVSPDTKEKTLVSSIAQKQRNAATPPPLPKGVGDSGGFLKYLLGFLGVIAGVGAFLHGLMTDGPLKGTMKVLSKLLAGGGLKLLKSALSPILHFIQKIFKVPLEIISKFGKGLLADMGKFAGEAIGKILPKGGKGLFGKLAKGILKFLKPAMKLLKRVPILGSLISIGFAISNFRNGDTIGGILDVVSGLVGLIDIVAPGVGTALSLGVDILHAFLDVKSGGSSPEASKKKGDILWNMGKTVGAWLWEKAEYIPVLGTIKWFGKAYDSFTSGNYMEAFKQLGLGLVSLVPGGGFLIKGVEMLMGFFSGEKEQDPTLTANKSWFGRLKDWVKSKLKDLPWWIKKPLSWFGIMEDDSGVSGTMLDNIGGGVKAGFEKAKEWIGGIWDNIKGPIGDSVGHIADFASGIWDNTKEYVSKSWDVVKDMAPKVWDSIKDISSKAWDTAKEAGSWFYDTVVSMASKTKALVDEWIPKIIDVVSNVTTKAMDALKGIANKIGSWVSGLFSSDEEKKIQEAKIQSTQTTTANTLTSNNDQAFKFLIKGNTTSNTWLEVLHKAAIDQVRLLTVLANTSNASLNELKRISGNSSGGGGTVIMSPPQSSSKTPMVPVNNNREGFSSSVYALS